MGLCSDRTVPREFIILDSAALVSDFLVLEGAVSDMYSTENQTASSGVAAKLSAVKAVFQLAGNANRRSIRTPHSVQYVDMYDRFDGDMSTMQLLFDAGALLHKGFDHFGWVMVASS